MTYSALQVSSTHDHMTKSMETAHETFTSHISSSGAYLGVKPAEVRAPYPRITKFSTPYPQTSPTQKVPRQAKPLEGTCPEIELNPKPETLNPKP